MHTASSQKSSADDRSLRTVSPQKSLTGERSVHTVSPQKSLNGERSVHTASSQKSSADERTVHTASAQKTSIYEDKSEVIEEESLRTDSEVKMTSSEKIQSDDESQVKLRLDTEHDDDSEMKLKLDADKSEKEEVAESYSPISKTAIVDVPDSARTDTDMVEEEFSVHTAHSMTERSESVKLILNKLSEEKTAAEEPTVDKVPDEGEAKLSDNIVDDDKHRSDNDASEKSFSYSTSRTTRSSHTSDDEEDSKSYSDTFSDDTINSHTDRKTRSERSAQKSESKRKFVDEDNKEKEDELSIAESLRTEEDLSEHLSIEGASDESTKLALDFRSQEKPVSQDEQKQGLHFRSPPEDDDFFASPRLETEEEVPDFEAEVDELPDLHVGERVLVGGVQPGILRFKGKTAFAEGFWGGVELDKPEGRNDGVKDGVTYFTCQPNCGIFAPPDKLSPLTGEFKECGVEGGADSHHTVTEAGLSKSLEYADSLVSDISSPPAKKINSTNQKVEKDIKEDGDEMSSIAEDVSVATVDSELERVISSAAAAVEGFGSLGAAESPVDDTLDSDVQMSLHLEENKLVNNVTDDILEMVVQDSVGTLGEMIERRGEAAEPPTDTASLLEKLADTTGQLNDEDDQQHEQQEDKKDKVVELAADKLLKESISQMLGIYKKQQQGLRISDEEEDVGELIDGAATSTPLTTPDTTPIQLNKTPATLKTDDMPHKGILGDDDFLSDDMFAKRVHVEHHDDMNLPPLKSMGFQQSAIESGGGVSNY